MTLGAGAPAVPAHQVTVLSPRTSRYCVLVFVLNEGERLHRQLARMQPWCANLDVVIADGGSGDGSVLPARVAGFGVRAVLVKQDRGALSAQMRMGLWWAIAEGYAGAVVIDGNDKDDPEALPAFAAALDAGWDHVQGSRYIDGGRGINTPRLRHWAVRLIHAPLISLAAHRRCTDTTNGFRAYSMRLLEDDRVRPFRSVFQDYELHYYLAIRAARLGFRCTEIPVTRRYPEHGPIPTRISPIRGNLRVLRELMLAVLGRFDPAGPKAAA